MQCTSTGCGNQKEWLFNPEYRYCLKCGTCYDDYISLSTRETAELELYDIINERLTDKQFCKTCRRKFCGKKCSTCEAAFAIITGFCDVKREIEKYNNYSTE